jgi:hypothetical protein
MLFIVWYHESTSNRNFDSTNMCQSRWDAMRMHQAHHIHTYPKVGRIVANQRNCCDDSDGEILHSPWADTNTRISTKWYITNWYLTSMRFTCHSQTMNTTLTQHRHMVVHPRKE